MPLWSRATGTTLGLAAAGLVACAIAAHPALAAHPGSSVRFEPNHGQLDGRVRFLARGRAHALHLTDAGATLALARPNGGDPADARRAPPALDRAAVSLRLVGARPVVPRGEAPLPGRTSYLLGADASRWRSGVEGYARVRYHRPLPGVDLLFYGAAEGQLEYDLVLAPGVDPAGVAVAFDGVEAVVLEASGHALLRLPGGFEVRQAPPVAYQDDGRGGRTPVAARYARRAGGALGFTVGPHDRTRPLVIDPLLVYATYLGGGGGDYAYGVASDGGGNAYLTGYTLSADFPTAGGQLPGAGGFDVFVTKIGPAGAGLIYSTYLGGAGADVGLAIAVDGAGRAHVTGYTYSLDFPAVAALQPARAGAADAFLARLDASGSALVYSTYLGGPADDLGQAVVVDSSGSAYVTGQTQSSGFPLVSPLQGAFGGVRDAFVTKFSASGHALIYSTLLGGSQDDFGQGIGVDAVGNAYVGGYTFSPNFPTANALQPAGAADFRADAFVSKLSPSGTALVYSTYLGGSRNEQAYGLAVEPGGAVTIAGYTHSTDFPTAAALQPTYRDGGSDAFVSKLNPAGSALVYSTYLGGNGHDLVYGLAIDGGGTHITGYTTSTDFPTTSQPQQATPGGGLDAFLTSLSPSGASLTSSSYLGGSGTDMGLSIAVNGSGLVVAGQTDSLNFPTKAALQGTRAGAVDVFVIRFASPSAVPAASAPLVLALGLGLGAIGLLALRRRRH